MASRLDILAMYGAGYAWDHLLKPKANLLLLATCLVATGTYRQTISIRIQEVINEITFVYYLEKGNT